MNRSAREDKKRFERSNRLDTELYKNYLFGMIRRDITYKDKSLNVRILYTCMESISQERHRYA